MKSLSKSQKKKIIIAVSVILVLVIISTVAGFVIADNNKPKVSLNTISTGDIYEFVGANGKVTSGATKKYSVPTVADVKEVFVNVGDTVHKGDLLATFDTSDFDKQVSNLESVYNSAKKDYNKSVSDKKANDNKIKSLDKEINSLQNQINKQKKNISKTQQNSDNAILDLVSNVVKIIDDYSQDVETVNALTTLVVDTISNEIKNGDYSPESIANAIETALNKSIADGNINVDEINIDIKQVMSQIRKTLKEFDWSVVAKAMKNDESLKLTSNELRVVTLQAQKELLNAANSVDIVSTKKDLMNTAKEAVNAMKEAGESLKQGWIAEFDGIITSCDIKAGEQTSALTSGIVLQNLNEMVVTISVNEYDLPKVNVGMPVKVTTAYGEYSGKVISKAPTAQGGSTSNIMDSVGSMAGISGLSSLTDKGAGVEVVVSVENPDDNIVVGFNADVEIETGEYLGVPVVPVESIVLEKSGSYVYLYNEEEKTVTKTKISTGAISDTQYEVTQGLEVGDKIVATPAADYEEDTFSVKVVK